MKTYICKNCGKEISTVELKHGYFQSFDECNCSSHQLTIPLEHYESYEDMKCPECGEYPFEDKPIFEKKVIKVVIERDEPLGD